MSLLKNYTRYLVVVCVVLIANLFVFAGLKRISEYMISQYGEKVPAMIGLLIVLGYGLATGVFGCCLLAFGTIWFEKNKSFYLKGEKRWPKEQFFKNK